MSSHSVMALMKYRLSRPQVTPSRMLAGTRSTVHAASRWNVNNDVEPLKMYVKHVAVTQDISIGRSEAMVRSIMSTSRVNTSPAMGALNMPAMAPAAPQPTSNTSVRLSILNSLPRFDPMAVPVNTMGASAPTEPPKPMVMAEASTDDQQLWPRRRLRLLLMA